MRPDVSAYYPFLLYFNQIYGSFIKVFVLFRLDRQRWTRQNTTGAVSGSRRRQLLSRLSSVYMNAIAVTLYVIVIATIVGALPALSLGDLRDMIKP
jgi:glycosyltransferase Alg8